nr:frizzled-3-like [Oncorhynchus nerka]
MMLVVGIPSVFWVGSKKTCFEWASFLHGQTRKDSVVNESRQVLQEPDFSQLLLQDPNTPVVRKSRGTSTQGTSTHASSTYLAMLDEPPSGSTSRASSVRSLYRSRDGRYTACSFHGVEDRLPYDSMLHLNDQSGSRHCSTNRQDSISRHGSTQRPESKSQHSSIKDLSNITQAIQSAPGNGIHRVLKENGATA